MSNLPPVVAVTGNHAYLRDRYLREFLAFNEKSGRLTERVDGKAPGAVSTSLSGGFLFSAPTQVVVTNLQERDFPLVLEHQDSGSTSTILILFYPGKPRGNTKFGKFLKKIGAHQTFEQPDRWKAPEEAASFVVKEAHVQGFKIDPALASAIVSKVGVDFGMLAFEVFKSGVLAQARGSDKILPEHVKQTMATIGEATFDGLFKAMETAHPKRLARALSQIRAKSRQDMTMGVCRSVGPLAVKWLCSASMKEAGMSDTVAASTMGLNPWYYRNKIVPVAQVWGKSRLEQLVAAFASSERAVLSGQLDPWAGLTCRLLRVCTSPR